jgi:hypothetical protein
MHFLHYEVDMSLWGPEEECYGVALKCPPKRLSPQMMAEETLGDGA